MTAASTRRYDLDWLRVIAFGILIFYHIGMFYVSWDWHVKSVHAGPAAELPMFLTNMWRLALLFFISGIALRYALDKGALLPFAGKRFLRLAAPIVFGMAVVVAPQAYFQLRYESVVEAGFWRFYPDYLSFAQKFHIITPTWNHLWYVVYMLFYSMLAIAAAPLLRPLADRLARIRGAGVGLLLLTPVPFLFYRFFLEPHFPTTHALLDDWANHAHSFTIFLVGFIVAKNDAFWAAVRRALPVSAAVAAAGAATVIFVWLGDHWGVVRANPVSAVAFSALRVIYAWAVIVTLASLGMRFLNRDSKALRYLTGAVFCYYILHQTITVWVGYYAGQAGLSWEVEFAALTLATFGGCAVGYELARRIPLLRPLLGIAERDAVKVGKRRAPARLAAPCEDVA